MKFTSRILALLLAIVMVVGLLPMSALAAENVVTLSFADGSGTNLDPISFTDEASGVSVVFTAGTHSTKPRWDAACVRFYGTTSVTNHLTVTAPTGANITRIAFTMDGSYGLTAVSADSGTIDTSTNTWTGSANAVVFTTTAQTRFNGATVTYETAGGETTCEHTNKVAIGEAKDATCTEDGITAGEKCADCGTTVTAQETIPALGHSYVDGACDRCGEIATIYTLVTDASTLKAGDKVIIAAGASAYALSTTQNSNNRGQAEIAKSEGSVIAPGSDVQILTLEAGNKEGTFAFNTGSGYLYAASSGSNHLKTETTLSDNSSWTIEITADGVATIKAQGTNTRNWLRYNSSSKIFSCYGSGQGDVVLYKLNAAATECEHPDMEPIAYQAPTCTEAGNEVGEYCPACEQTFGATVIPATGHVAGDDGICTGCNTHIVELAYALADYETLPGGSFTLTGKITFINTAYSDQYKNITVTIAVEGYEDKPIQCYHLAAGEGYFDADTAGLSVGDIITVTGELKNFKSTIEFDSGCVFTNVVSSHTHNYIAETTDATCTQDGLTVYTCECGTSYTETIPATGHSYVDGICSVCGTEKPIYSLVPDIKTIAKVDTVIITMTNSDGKTYALSSANGSGKAPAAVEVSVVDGKIDTENADILWNIVNINEELTIYPAGSTAEWLYCFDNNNGLRIGDGADKTFVVDSTYNYLYNNGQRRYIGVYNNADWRSYTTTPDNNNIKEQTLGFYVAKGVCEHTNTHTVDAVAATCTENGYTEGVYCDDCLSYISGHETIEAAHKDEDADYICDVCNERLRLIGNYYIVALKDTYRYMTDDLGTADTKRYYAVDSTLTEIPKSIENANPSGVFTLTNVEDNIYNISAKGQYLSWTSGNSGVLSDTPMNVTVETAEDGTYTIRFIDSEARYLCLNTQSGDYFAWYKASSNQQAALALIPVNSICTNHSYGEGDVTAPTCTAAGYTTHTCTICGHSYTDGEIPATGHTLVDGVCADCGNAPAIKSAALVLESTLQLKIGVSMNTFSAKDCRIHVTIGDDTEYQDLAVYKNALIPAHRLNETVKIEMLFGETVVSEQTWAMGTYADSLRESHKDDAEMMALLTALENYADYAAAYANGAALADVTATIPEELKQNVTVNTDTALKPVASLYLDDACDITVKFDAEAFAGYTLHINNGEAVENIKIENGKAIYTVAEGLMPQQWNDIYTITVKDAAGNAVFSVEYSAMSYAHAALSVAQEAAAGLNNLLKAMYLYCQAAEVYAAN